MCAPEGGTARTLAESATTVLASNQLERDGRMLEWLFGKPNPTANWRDEGRSHVLDLDVHEFCGVGFGDPFDRLDFLGPGEIEGIEFAFRKHGVLVDAPEAESGRRMDGFTVFLGHADEPNSGRFTGGVIARGVEWGISTSTREAAFVERFGEPYWRDVDDDEVILFYEWSPSGDPEPEVEWQVEFGMDGGLKTIVVQRPLLASAEQRRLYGITKPWPPA